MKVSKTGGLIAAASQRAARPTLQLGSITAVQRIVMTFQQAGIFPIAVVTGVEADEVKYRLSGRGVVFLHNSEFQDPELLDSIRLGLGFLQDKCDRIAFAPVNVPLFAPATLQALLRQEGDFVTPTVNGTGGHPILLSNRMIPDILSYTGDGGLRGAMAQMHCERTRVEVEDDGIHLTFHEQAQLEAHLKRQQSAFVQPNMQFTLEQEEMIFGVRAKLLLLLIEETHSVRTAGDMMAMSISKAWDTLNKLESALGYPLILRRQGGQQGSGSELTPRGRVFLQAFQTYEERAHAESRKVFEDVFLTSNLLTQ
ncbi:MAG TPA: NTP transferase domain-containing protein [Clostridia bacterium]|nr:NTP transferase domain-containing protein [Clostridia bacterium]